MQIEIDRKLKKYAMLMVACQFIGILSLSIASVIHTPLGLAVTMGLGGGFTILGIMIWIGSMLYEVNRNMKGIDRMGERQKRKYEK